MFACLPGACLVAVILGLVFAPAALAVLLGQISEDPVPLIVLYMLVGVAHNAGFVIHAVRNPRVQGARRASWVLALALASGIAAPIYWWKGLTASVDS